MLALHSHSHDVTGIDQVPAILSRTLTPFGYKDVSHSLIDKSGVLLHRHFENAKKWPSFG